MSSLWLRNGVPHLLLHGLWCCTHHISTHTAPKQHSTQHALANRAGSLQREIASPVSIAQIDASRLVHFLQTKLGSLKLKSLGDMLQVGTVPHPSAEPVGSCELRVYTTHLDGRKKNA